MKKLRTYDAVTFEKEEKRFLGISNKHLLGDMISRCSC